MVMLPVDGSGLVACFSGPFVIQRKVCDTNNVISNPENRRSIILERLCQQKRRSKKCGDCFFSVLRTSMSYGGLIPDDGLVLPEESQPGRLANSEFLAGATSFPSYFPSLFDIPSRTCMLVYIAVLVKCMTTHELFF